MCWCNYSSLFQAEDHIGLDDLAKLRHKFEVRVTLCLEMRSALTSIYSSSPTLPVLIQLKTKTNIQLQICTFNMHKWSKHHEI